MATSRATVTINVECAPCVPDWQPTGQTRCQAGVIQAQEANGCGDTRWVDTSTPCGDAPCYPPVYSPALPAC